VRVKRSAWAENARYASVFLAVNAALIGGLGYVVMARYLEALRRYNLGLPTGYDEYRLKQRHFLRQGLASNTPPNDEPTGGHPPSSRLDWPD